MHSSSLWLKNAIELLLLLLPLTNSIEWYSVTRPSKSSGKRDESSYYSGYGGSDIEPSLTTNWVRILLCRMPVDYWQKSKNIKAIPRFILLQTSVLCLLTPGRYNQN